MTGNKQRYAISGTGASHRARRFRHSHLSRKLAIGPRLSSRDPPQRIPHAKLERRPSQIEFPLTRRTTRIAGFLDAVQR